MLAAHPDHFQAAVLLVTIFRGNGNEDHVGDILQSYKATAPGDFRGPLHLGSHFHEKADYGQALENYKHALALSPDQPQVMANLGRIYYELRDYERARTYLETALEKASDNGHYVRHLGELYITTGQLDKEWAGLSLIRHIADLHGGATEVKTGKMGPAVSPASSRPGRNFTGG